MPEIRQVSVAHVFTADPEIQSNTLSDRELHDRLICYLTDANLRSSGPSIRLLDETQSERAQRFSRFLARRYYRDRLQRGFRYSANLLGSARAADIVDAPQFDAVLADCVLGSLTTAKAVGNLALACLQFQRNAEWWNELLEYELAFFLQLATLELPRAAKFPQLGPSAIVREFEFRIPEILLKLKSGEVSATNARGSTVLLFSRTPHGKIYVVELDEAAAAVVREVDGRRMNTEIARASDVPLEEATRILGELVGINVIVAPDGDF